MLSLGGSHCRLEVEAYFFAGLNECSCGRTCDENLVSDVEVYIFDEKLSHFYLAEIFHAFAHIHFFLCGLAAVYLTPFSEFLSLVVAIPESAVEDSSELSVLFFLGLVVVGEGACKNRFDGVVVCLDDSMDIFGSAGTSFYLEDSYTSVHHHVDEAYGLEVAR